MLDYENLKGKVAIVTGGGKGLGYAIAEQFIKAGMKTILIGRNEEILKDACHDFGKNAFYYVHDLSKLDTIPDLIDRIEERFFCIDVLVNNAGIHLKKDLVNVTDKEFCEIIQLNQHAVFATSREVAHRMQKQRSGSIIMISSMASQYGIPKVIAYTASKSAVEGMTRAMAVEMGGMGVRVNCIAPGFIETDMSAAALEKDLERKNKVLSRTPLERLGKPEEIGKAAVFLASDAAQYITGVVLPVDGGNSIGF